MAYKGTGRALLAAILLSVCLSVAHARGTGARGSSRINAPAAGESHGVASGGEEAAREPTGPRALFGWGRNNAGQLGLGHSNDVSTPEILGNTFHAKNIKLVAAGGGNEEQVTGGFSLVVTSGGMLYSVGANARGQLGVGDNEDRHALVPVNLRTKSPVVRVGAGMGFAVAVTQDGRMYSWGANDFGQLGLGDTRDRSSPELIAGALTKQEVQQVACGAEHAIIITSSGLLFTWGSNSNGQLGLGSSTPRQLVPTVVQGAITGIKFSAVDSGHNHVLAASKSGEVYCWGANSYGQLGLGDFEDRNTPHALLHKFTRSKITRVAAGARHSLAVTENGELFSWGSNDCGQLGMEIKGGRKYVGYPHRIESLKVGRIKAGATISAAFLDTGRAFMWGCSNNGELGLGDVERRSSPHVVPTPGGVQYGQLAPGNSHVLGVNRNGELFGWGCNSHGQLGLAYTTPNELRPQLIASATSTDVTAVATGGFAYEYQGHTLAVAASGKVFTWGWNAFGQLGLGTLSAGAATPNRLFDLEKPLTLRQIDCGQYNTAALFVKKKQPGLMTWGPNYNGQLGYHFNELGPSLVPTKLEVLAKGTDLVEVSYGYNHVLALAADGIVHVWGGNTHGQLGTGDSKDRNKPTAIRAFHGAKVVHVAAGQHSSFAVTESGEVFGWGYNDNMELGLGTGTSRNSPQVISSLAGKNVTRIAAGGYHVLAATGAGELYAWGSNRYGQLGLGHTNPVKVPTKVQALPKLAAGDYPTPYEQLLQRKARGVEAPTDAIYTGVIAAGTWHSLAVVEGGRLLSWGRNSAGQLGLTHVQLGTVVETPSAVDALADTYVVAVVAAAAHTLAIGHPGNSWSS
eukprot:CAMPEP_0117664012 /NCGR_PEP_ID=MMETSP0804-20121206/8955_1 /TAXON_ID=1074897 /ORGANISM="Tetraselmis astigmatica, Strain CCMP880" /LENGTH=853 /DNA_ID=CAMNT_0005471141 /DNA_START=124 /DNA_END=2685 /DNA_ORIENTATION=-